MALRGLRVLTRQWQRARNAGPGHVTKHLPAALDIFKRKASPGWAVGGIGGGTGGLPENAMDQLFFLYPGLYSPKDNPGTDHGLATRFLAHHIMWRCVALQGGSACPESSSFFSYSSQ
jgi:hypothetical protein